MSTHTSASSTHSTACSRGPCTVLSCYHVCYCYCSFLKRVCCSFACVCTCVCVKCVRVPVLIMCVLYIRAVKCACLCSVHCSRIPILLCFVAISGSIIGLCAQCVIYLARVYSTTQCVSISLTKPGAFPRKCIFVRDNVLLLVRNEVLRVFRRSNIYLHTGIVCTQVIRHCANCSRCHSHCNSARTSCSSASVRQLGTGIRVGRRASRPTRPICRHRAV